MSSEMRVRAFAKINLSLRVLGARADGYHELRTVFQAIALHDTLDVRRTDAPFALTCSGVAASADARGAAVAADRTNLVWRAADALWKQARRRGTPRGAAVHLIKRIPVAAGLGGGSSDAAAALRALATLWRVDGQCVREAAVRLGADVPFFLEGGTVLGLERGDVLFPLVDRPRAWVVLVVPPFGVSTPEAYGWWDADRTSLDRRRSRSDEPGTSAARGPLAPSASNDEALNDLQAPVAKRHPEIRRIVRELDRAGAACAAMSGSGSAVFGLFRSRAAAERAARVAARPRRRVLVTRTATRAECVRLAAN